MTAYEYSIQYKLLLSKRQPEPKGWWCTWDDRHNRSKLSALPNIINQYPNDYKRELKFQIELKKINAARIVGVRKPINGQKINIANTVIDENYSYKRAPNAPEIIMVTIVSDDIQIGSDGSINFYVRYDFRSQSTAHFLIESHEIINPK